MVTTVWSLTCQARYVAGFGYKGNSFADAGAGFRPGFVSVEVYVLMLESTLEAFDEHVVQLAAPAIHGNVDSIGSQDIRKGEAGKLAALVAVENIRPPYFDKASSWPKTKIRLQCTGKPPGQHFSTVSIHHGNQIQKIFAHGNIM